jgi:adenylate cyclase
MFSDVRGFTTISESYKNDPQGLTHLMNRFLTPVTHAIIDRNGTIDKYIGDAVMAFWNAPLENPSHESDACYAALGMLECVESLNKEREREAAVANTQFVPIKIGIGINTGRCTVGNMGSDLRFQYTVMGDSVNLASRLEGQTKSHGVSIILGSNTALAVAKQFALLEIDTLRVKGKREAEVIYTIVGRADVGETAEFKAFQEHWNKVLEDYRSGHWRGSLKSLAVCRCECNKFGLLGLLDIYEERIRHLEQSPPGADWDGVFDAETK